MALRILTDSACDIDLSLQDSLDLKILPLKVFFGEKSTEISFECDFEDQRTFIQLSEGERELAVRKGKNHYSIGR